MEENMVSVYYTSIYQLSCTRLRFFSHILVLALTRFGVYEHHIQGVSIQLRFLHNTSYTLIYAHLAVVC